MQGADIVGDFAGYDRCYCPMEEGCSSDDWGNYSLGSRSCGKLYSVIVTMRT